MNRINVISPAAPLPVAAPGNAGGRQQVRDFEQALDNRSPVPTPPMPSEADVRFKRWLDSAPLATVMAGLEHDPQRSMLWQWYRQDLPAQAEPRRKELKEALMGGFTDRLLVQFTEPQAGPELDRLALKAQLKELAPFGKQQEALLFNVLAEIKNVAGSDYLAGLVRRELQVQIPLNAMLDNLMRNTHKPDLES